jgi:lipopolysaccharide export system protein LptA
MGFAVGLLAFAAVQPARAQALNLSHGGPITVTAKGGIEWRQKSQEVIATQDAKAVRGTTTVTADELIAHYRKKQATPGSAPAPASANGKQGADQGSALDGNNQIYLLEARGNVHIFTPTDQAVGDHAAYDMDQGVLVITGHALKLTTPTYVLTARDSLEYWSNQHMAVARGDAVLVTNTGRRIAADVLVAYTDKNGTPGQGAAAATVADRTPAAGAGPASDADDPSGKLKRVDAIGHVVIMTTTDIVQGDRAVYDPKLGIARIAGSVRITRGQNVLVGDEALVNMKTGVSRLLSQGDTQVKGLIIPNQANQPAVGLPPAKPPAPAK